MILLASVLPFLQWMVDFIHWAKAMGLAGGALYAVVYILGTALLFPALPLTLGAGFLYGAVIGTLVVSPASVAGATVAFLIARYLARDRVTRRLKKYPQAAAIDRAIENNGFKAVVLLRLQPLLDHGRRGVVVRRRLRVWPGKVRARSAKAGARPARAWRRRAFSRALRSCPRARRDTAIDERDARGQHGAAMSGGAVGVGQR